MSDGYTFPASERIKSKAVVGRLFNATTAKVFAYPVKCLYIIEKSTSPGVEVLFSVPKRNHKRANVRNRHKRLMRESYRLSEVRRKLQALAEERGVAIRIAFVYISKEELPYNPVCDAVTKLLAEVVELC